MIPIPARFPIILVLLATILAVSCTETQVVQRTQEEIAFAREAVVEMTDMVVKASANILSENKRWTPTASQMIPGSAVPIVDSVATIPGIELLLESYLKEVVDAVASIGGQVHEFYEDSLKQAIPIDDPFEIIGGDEDAITRHFASEAATKLEIWIVEQLNGETGKKAVEAWNELLWTYNTYAAANNRLYPENEESHIDSIEESIHRTVAVQFIRRFIETMTSQEALLRTMAPAYDDPRITIFGTL